MKKKVFLIIAWTSSVSGLILAWAWFGWRLAVVLFLLEFTFNLRISANTYKNEKL